MTMSKKNRAIVIGHDMNERAPRADGFVTHDEVVLYTDEDDRWLDLLSEYGATEVNLGVPGPGLWVWEGRARNVRCGEFGSEVDIEFNGESRRLTPDELEAVANGRNPFAPGRAAEHAADAQNNEGA
jgi:hypothetical protein